MWVDAEAAAFNEGPVISGGLAHPPRRPHDAAGGTPGKHSMSSHAWSKTNIPTSVTTCKTLPGYYVLVDQEGLRIDELPFATADEAARALRSYQADARQQAAAERAERDGLAMMGAR